MVRSGLAELAVEVLHNSGDDTNPDWLVGSGYVVRDNLVLTAAHTVGINGELLVRFAGADEKPARLCRFPDGRPALDEGLDLALVEISGQVPLGPPVGFVRLDLDPPPGAPNVGGCWGIGFPWLQEKRRDRRAKPVRESRRLDGYLPAGEGMVEHLATLRVQDAPADIPIGDLQGTPWEGISGTVVFAGELAVGVVLEHHRRGGINSLTLMPIARLDELDNAGSWWELLGVDDPQALAVLPERGQVTDSGFHAQLTHHAEAMLRDERYQQWMVPGPDGPVVRAVQPHATRYRGPAAKAEPLLHLLAGSAPKIRVVLLGAPGGGKTTALELFGCNLLRGPRNTIASQERPLPILVNLRDYAGEPSLLPVIRNALRQHGVLKPSEQETELLLDYYNCVVLLDGLNEIGSGKRENIVTAINRLTAAHPESGIVASCRITDFEDFESSLTAFQLLRLTEWQPDQIVQFLAKFANCGAEGLTDDLDRLDDPSILSNPFILSLVARLGRKIDPHMQQVDILREYVHGERVLGSVPTRNGLRQKLLPTARRVAYAIRQNYQRKLSINNIFAEIEAERGMRGYEFEEMFAALHQAGLVISNDEDGWFRYEYLEEFLSAELMADRLSKEEVVRLAADIEWRQAVSLYFSMTGLSMVELEGFLGPEVDRWVRHRAASLLGERGDPRLDSMVRVPGGRFILGRDGGPPEEGPAHFITLGPFDIDKFPVTNIQYAQFLANTGRESPAHWIAGHLPPGTDNQPVTNVSWEDALEYATWAHKRLPTEAEWEKAASWAEDERKFHWPWGDQFDPARLNSDTSSRFWFGSPTPVGIYAHGASRYGLLDMCGNVWEWTSSAFKPYPYDPNDGREDHGYSRRRVLRGGSWRSTSPYFLTVTKRDAFVPSASLGGNVGFRCARDAKSGVLLSWTRKR
jgi:formylglycine-generating enzyme required for sulfatase activity